MPRSIFQAARHTERLRRHPRLPPPPTTAHWERLIFPITTILLTLNREQQKMRREVGELTLLFYLHDSRGGSPIYTTYWLPSSHPMSARFLDLQGSDPAAASIDELARAIQQQGLDRTISQCRAARRRQRCVQLSHIHLGRGVRAHHLFFLLLLFLLVCQTSSVNYETVSAADSGLSNAALAFNNKIDDNSMPNTAFLSLALSQSVCCPSRRSSSLMLSSRSCGSG